MAIHFPNETEAYRTARTDLLHAEAELRAAIEAVAAQRRRLPLGGVVEEDYALTRHDANGTPETVRLSGLFAPNTDTLFVYGFMFGPEMPAACPMCSSMLDGLDGQIVHLQQRMNVGVVASSPVDRIMQFARERGWTRLPLLSSHGTTFLRDYHAENEQGGQMPMANVFVKRNGAIHHFWGSELLYHPGDGQPRHVDLLWPLWNVLDLTPTGRGETWHPSLSYE